jgi:hypothetical protein
MQLHTCKRYQYGTRINNDLFCFAHLSKLFPSYTQVVVVSFFPRLQPFTPSSDEQMQVSKQEDWSLYESQYKIGC